MADQPLTPPGQPTDQPAKLRFVGRTHKHQLETDVFTAGLERMRYVYRTYGRSVVVSWSGGKDSTACLYLAKQAARELDLLPVNVFFLDEEVIYPETVELALRHRADPEINFVWACIPAIYRNACSQDEPNFIPWDPARKALWVRTPPDFAVWPAGQEGCDWTNPPHPCIRAIRELWPRADYPELVEVSGLRTQESFVRYSGILSSASYLTNPAPNGLIGCRPVYDWKASDIWLAIKQFGWDYNRAYDKLWRLGGTINNLRVAPLFGAEGSVMLRRVMLAWPHFWQKVRYRVAGAHALAIYDGKLHVETLRPGELWRDAAYRYLSSLADNDRFEQEKQLAAALAKHAAHSSYTLDETALCPECSLSWRKITRIIRLADRHSGRQWKTHPKFKSAVANPPKEVKQSTQSKRKTARKDRIKAARSKNQDQD